MKYYYNIHCAKQKAQGNTPVCYWAFTRRLRKMNLHDAIYKPRVEYNVRDGKSKTPIQDAIRRKQINKEENIQILDLDNLMKVEKRTWTPPKPKKTFIQKVISWIKKQIDKH